MARNYVTNKVSVAESIGPQVNRYYLKVSKRYMIVGIIMVLLLFLYVICVMTFFGDYVTYDNLKYLSRDFSAVSIKGDMSFSKIVYNGRENMSFGYFRDGLAVANGDILNYYDSSGICLIEDDINYSEPVIEGGEKYMLVYDLGGTGYSVYNQLTKIIGRDSDGRIMAGDIGDDGTCILVSRSRDTKYVVELYNSAFNKSMSIYKDNYVLDAAVSPDGSRIIICSAIPSDTDFSCEIDICAAGKSESVSVMTYERTMPLGVYTSDYGFALLCDKGMYFFDYDGHIISSCDFNGMSLRIADINETSAVIVGGVNALGRENRVLVFDLSGEKLYDSVVNLKITGAYASRSVTDALAYLKTSSSIVMIDKDGAEINLNSTETGDIMSVVPMTEGAVICRRSSASFARADNDFTDSKTDISQES